MSARQQTVPITVRIPAKAHQTLHEAAKKHGYQPSHYAQLIFDAAFAARIGIERGETPTDRDLDELCRAVFCLAGQFNTAAIGKALGASEPLVIRILDAWRDEARRAGKPVAAGKKSTEAKGV